MSSRLASKSKEESSERADDLRVVGVGPQLKTCTKTTVRDIRRAKTNACMGTGTQKHDLRMEDPSAPNADWVKIYLIPSPKCAAYLELRLERSSIG